MPFPDGRRVQRRSNHNQLWAEITQLVEFAGRVDARGLRLPEDSQQQRTLLRDLREGQYAELVARGDAVRPPDELLSTLALAQHYGVPTRLLDWTRHPLITAYFAAVEAVARPARGRLAVWACNVEMIDAPDTRELLGDFKCVTAPGADIPNLQAQQGVFLLLRMSKFRPSATFRPLAYDTVVRAILWHVGRPMFYRFTLPSAQASILLQLLSKWYGVDGSTLFPGFAGVAKAVAEQRSWPPPGSDLGRGKATPHRYRTLWTRLHRSG